MADYDYSKAGEEAGKAVQKATDLAQSFGGYVAKVSEGAPEAFFGIITDRLKYIQGVQAISLFKKAKKRLEDAGLDSSKLAPPSPNIEIPLLEAATLEDRDQLCLMWEKLLAAAINPSSRDRVRLSHIQILKSLEPLDALILERFVSIIAACKSLPKDKFFGNDFYEKASYVISRDITDVHNDEVFISLKNLVRLELMLDSASQTIPSSLAPLGRDFLRVVRSVNS